MAIKHRIEIKFVGTAPDDELARARIIANTKVEEYIEKLREALIDLDVEVTVTAHSVRTTDQRQNRRPRLVDAAE